RRHPPLPPAVLRGVPAALRWAVRDRAHLLLPSDGQAIALTAAEATGLSLWTGRYRAHRGALGQGANARRFTPPTRCCPIPHPEAAVPSVRHSVRARRQPK